MVNAKSGLFYPENTEWVRDEDGQESLVYVGDSEEFCEENEITMEEFEKALAEYEEISLEAIKDADEWCDARAAFQGGRW